jgi:His-Xaa-Ser system protein HxsD
MVWSGIETDVLGERATVSVDTSLYSEQVIFRAAYWLTDRFYLFLSREDEKVRVEVRNKPDFPVDLQQACGDFCNSLIDFRLREIVAKEADGIREALVRQAFLEGVPKPGLAGARSNEGHLTKADS